MFSLPPNLFFDIDRSEVISQALKSDRAEIIKEMAPGLAELPRNDKPPIWCQAGETARGSGEYKYARKSCFHWCHPEYFVSKNTMNAVDVAGDDNGDYQLDSITRNIAFSTSPNARN